VTLAAGLRGTIAGSSADKSKRFDLQISITGLGEALGKVDPALGSIDVAQINQALDLLRNTDFSSIAKAVEDAADQAGRLFDDLPDASSLVTALENALARLLAGIDADIGRALGDIEAAARKLAERLRQAALTAPDLDLSVGAARLAEILEIVARAVSSPLLSLVLAAFARVAGTVLGGWNVLSGQGAGFGALVTSLGSLGSLDDLSKRAWTLSLVLARPFEGGRLDATIGRLRVASADLAIVEGLKAPLPDTAAVVEFCEDLEQLARLLGDAFGAGLGALHRIDLDTMVAGIEAHSAQLLGAGLTSVGELAKALRIHVEPLLHLRLPELGPGQTGAAYVADAMAGAAGAVAKARPDEVAKPVTDGLARALAPVHELRVVVERTTAGIEAAVRALASAAATVDLAAVGETLRRALRPVADALAVVGTAVTAAKDAIDKVAAALTTRLGSVGSDVEKALGPILAAFEAVSDALVKAGLDELIAGLRAAVDEVATILRAAPLQPFIDTAVDIMNTGADILAAVPKDLLPAPVRAELHDACVTIQGIDFAGVTGKLKDELKDIVASVEEMGLTELDDLYRELLGFIEEIDPRPQLHTLETTYFEDFVAKLKAIDPAELLAPVAEALAELRAAIPSFDPDELLAPIDAVFDELAAGFAKLDPKTLLAPLVDGAAALKAQINDALPVGDAITRITQVDRWVTATLGHVDPIQVLGVLDAIYDGLVGGIRELACETGLLAGSLRALLVGVDLDVPLASLAEGWRWISGTDGAAVMSERFRLLSNSVDTAQQAVGRFDYAAMIGDLARTHKAIAAEVALLPVGSDVRRLLEPVLGRTDPTVLFAPFALDEARHKKACDDAKRALRRIEGSSWSQVTVAAEMVRDQLRPLAALPDRLRALLAWLGADVDQRGLAKAVDDLLGQFRPSVVMKPLVTALTTVGAEVATVVSRVIAPVLRALSDVKGLVDLIGVPVPRELIDLHAELSKHIGDLRPKVVLGDTLAAVKSTRDLLVAFDPLEDVKQVVAAIRAAIAKLVEDVRPSVLLAPVLTVYDRIVATASGLDVRALLGPVVEALDDLEGQLAAGLTDAGTALEGLKDACTSPGGLSVGVKVLS